MNTNAFLRVSLGQKIKSLRRKRNLLQRHLAKEINRSRTFIYNLENGTRDFRIDNLLALSKALGFKLVIDNGEISFHLKGEEIESDNKSNES